MPQQEKIAWGWLTFILILVVLAETLN